MRAKIGEMFREPPKNDRRQALGETRGHRTAKKKKQLQRRGKHFVVQNRDEIVLENASPPEPAMHIELGPTWARTCCQGSTLRSDSSSNERMTEGQISHK